MRFRILPILSICLCMIRPPHCQLVIPHVETMQRYIKLE